MSVASRLFVGLKDLFRRNNCILSLASAVLLADLLLFLDVIVTGVVSLCVFLLLKPPPLFFL